MEHRTTKAIASALRDLGIDTDATDAHAQIEASSDAPAVELVPPSPAANRPRGLSAVPAR